MPNDKIKTGLTSTVSTDASKDLTKVESTVPVGSNVSSAATNLVAGAATQTPVTLAVNQPVTTDVPQLLAAGGQPGIYTYQLVVKDDIGGISQPVKWQVQITQPVIQ